VSDVTAVAAMTSSDKPGELELPARRIPVPRSVSPEAAAYLAHGAFPAPNNPALDDAEAWRQMIATIDSMVLERLRAGGLTDPDGFAITEVLLPNAVVYEVTPPTVESDDPRVYLDPHGGAFIVGGGEVCRANAVATATKFGMRVWALDYRMPPDHPYPAAVDDCIDAYRAVLRDRRPEQVVVGGVSAGGNLTAALILRARDEGMPLPAAAVLLTPGLDMTNAGDTWATNRGVDTVLGATDGAPIRLYAGDADPTDPYLSPLFGDFTKGFPPTLLASGTRDVLLSDTVRMHRALRAANVDAELHVLEAAPHGFFGGLAPEEKELEREVRRFIAEHCPKD
jgi:epsilon-lactone hydrolase